MLQIPVLMATLNENLQCLSMVLQSQMWEKTGFVKVLTAWMLHKAVVWPVCTFWLPQEKCLLGEERSRVIAVSHTLTKHPNIHSENTVFKTSWLSPLTRLSILTTDNCFLYCFSGLWAFCQAVLLLTNVFATKIWSCYEFDPLDIIHILGLITPNFLPICVMIIAALTIFQACIWVGVHIGKGLIYTQIRQIVRLFEF